MTAPDDDDKTAQIRNAVTGQPVATLTGHTKTIRSASFSPDGTRVVTASDDVTVRVWDASTGHRVAILKGHTNRIRSALFSPDGTRVITASDDATVRVWNVITSQPVAILETNAFAVSISPDGTRVVTAVSGNTARIWAVADDYLQGLIRAQNRLCLRADFRQVNLGSSPHEAAGHERACNACVPKFFARVKGVPPGDSKTYMAAWRDYRQCLDDTK